MNLNDLENRQGEIRQRLETKQLGEAIRLTENLLLTDTDWQLSNRLEQVKTSYHYMLQYLCQGIDDPQRPRLFRKLLAEVWHIFDQTCHRIARKYSGKLYYRTSESIRQLQQGGESLQSLISRAEAFADDLSVAQLTDRRKENIRREYKAHEAVQDQLFDFVWTNTEWTPEDFDAAIGTLHSDTLLTADLCLLLSAVTLSLLENFDERKIQFVIDASLHDDDAVCIRSMVCLTLVICFHGTRIKYCPELANRFALLKGDATFCNRLNMVFLQLFHAENTRNITRQIQEDIMPGVMETIQKSAQDPEAFDENDTNPDWEKLSPELNEKFRRMTDLLMEGNDVYMSSFSLMKQFPFFHTIAHWFLPYYTEHSLVTEAVSSLEEEEEAINLILNSSGICDSDKYSLLCVFPSIPAGQRNLLLQQFSKEENKEIIQENKEEVQKRNRQPEVILNNYMHCLYRFYKLFAQRQEFTDIFGDVASLYRLPQVREFIHAPENLREAADFLFKSERYEDAMSIFALLIEKNEATVSDYQKAGYCRQKAGAYAEAIELLTQADMMAPSNSWTLRHLATCHRLASRYKEALHYYYMVRELLPENKSVIYQTGICLLKSGDFDEALQKFFQLDLMNGESSKVWRAIGWCSFMQNKYEQAEQYIRQVIAREAQATDYLNLGHIRLVQGEIGEAVKHYQKAAAEMQTETSSRDSFRNAFVKDQEVLTAKGVDPQLFPLLTDLSTANC